jgi:shikimate kinase
MKSNITLIGMPGAGKSTVGIILAKNLGAGFIDTDVLIQINQQKRLQEIIEACGHLQLRAIEEQEILKINIANHVIATGGSAVYSEKAMIHLRALSTIVFLKVDFDVLIRRIQNFETRGIAKAKNQSFQALFEERQILYRKYADITFDCNRLNQEQAAVDIAAAVSKFGWQGGMPDLSTV